MTDDPEPAPMKRFWFTTWREDVLFHARPGCPRIENNVTDEREPYELPVAHIPVDAATVGSPPKIKICDWCGPADPFK